jgi:hypothetical protein
MEELYKPENLVASHTTFLIALVHGLVTINTVLFICESFKLVMHASKLTKEHQRIARRLYYVIIFVLVFSVSISGFFGWSYAKAFYVLSARPGDWSRELHNNERWLIVLFFLFVVADFLLLKICSLWVEDTGGADSGYMDVKRFQQDTDRFLRACDVPGLIGILLIFLLSNGFSFDQKDHYIQGFILGAVGLHITFSQAILAALSVPNAD